MSGKSGCLRFIGSRGNRLAHVRVGVVAGRGVWTRGGRHRDVIPFSDTGLESGMYVAELQNIQHPPVVAHSAGAPAGRGSWRRGKADTELCGSFAAGSGAASPAGAERPCSAPWEARSPATDSCAEPTTSAGAGARSAGVGPAVDARAWTGRRSLEGLPSSPTSPGPTAAHPAPLALIPEYRAAAAVAGTHSTIRIPPALEITDVCFGREGCRQAYIYLPNHPQDIAGAKEMAATYCVKNYSKCHGDGRLIDAVTSLTKEVEDIILLRGMLKVACSFNKSTQVLMDDGSRKGIGKIKPGEKVQAADPVTGKHAGARTVAASLVHHDDDLTDVAIRTKGGRMATVHTTSRHPFWDATTHTWVPPGRLVPGHRLNTATGKNSFVVAVRVTPGSADMYNLTVGQLHTYYVLAGQTPVLVHNSTCPEVDEISRNISNHALESAKRPMETAPTS